MSAAFVFMFNEMAAIKVKLDKKSIEAMKRIRSILENGKNLQKALAVGTVANQLIGNKSWQAAINVSTTDWKLLRDAMMSVSTITIGRIETECNYMILEYQTADDYELRHYWENFRDAITK